MKHFLLLIIFLFVFLCLFSCSSYSSKEYDELYDKYTLLEEDYTILKYENDELKSKITDLEEKISSQETEYHELYSEHEDLTIHNDVMNDKFGSCIDDIASLYWFFEQDDDISFESAKESFDRFYEIYQLYFHY